jgi:hypothetical protein
MVDLKGIGKGLVCLVCLWSCETMASQSYLHVWESMDDVTKFYEYVTEHGADDGSIALDVVENTVKTIKDPLKCLCILEKAMYAVSSLVPLLNDAISSAVRNIVSDEKAVPTNIIPNTPQMFTMRLAYMLIISQTKNYEGKELIPQFEAFPLEIASELLSIQRNGLFDRAKELLEMIKQLQGE